MATVKVKRRVKVLAKAASASVGSAAVHAGKQAKNGNSQGFRLVRPLFQSHPAIVKPSIIRFVLAARL